MVNKTLKELKKLKYKIPKNTYKTMKGQILSGDIEGFYKGLNKMLQIVKK